MLSSSPKPLTTLIHKVYVVEPLDPKLVAIAYRHMSKRPKNPIENDNGLLYV